MLGVLFFDGFIVYGFAHPSRIERLPASVVRVFRNTYIRSRNIIQYDESCSRYDDELGWTLKPGTCRFVNSEFSIAISANSLGLRDSEESLRGPQIIVLGDSYAMGWGVPEAATFPQVIARSTGERVLNAGIAGYGTVREMRLLDRLDVSRLSTLIVEYCPNDYDEDNGEYFRRKNVYVPMPRAQYENMLENDRKRRRYFLGKYAFDVVEGALSTLLRTSPVTAVKADAGSPVRPDAEAAAFLNALTHAARARLTHVRIIVFSTGNAEFIAALRAAITKSRSPSWVKHIEVVDLPEEARSGFVLDDHWSARGHALVAAALLHRLGVSPDDQLRSGGADYLRAAR
ncbi:MAG TPA: hypothetical protein VN915_14625 [Elusimicrobiota bacterium]|nr:hypothetical protein [Elusimicrobiota bacterium]